MKLCMFGLPGEAQQPVPRKDLQQTTSKNNGGISNVFLKCCSLFTSKIKTKKGCYACLLDNIED